MFTIFPPYTKGYVTYPSKFAETIYGILSKTHEDTKKELPTFRKEHKNRSPCGVHT